MSGSSNQLSACCGALSVVGPQRNIAAGPDLVVGRTAQRHADDARHVHVYQQSGGYVEHGQFFRTSVHPDCRSGRNGPLDYDRLAAVCERWDRVQQTLVATGGSGARTWTLNEFNYLPPGLALASNGTLSGTPTVAGQFPFTIAVTDAAAQTTTRFFNVLVYPAGVTFPPTIFTGPATNITATTATLIATVIPNGQATTVSFQYGLTNSYGTTTAPISIGSGSSPLPVSSFISALACNTLYHFRATAISAGGTSFGSDVTFITASCAPAVFTGVATVIGLSDATLNGLVSATGFATSASFEWGQTTGYGNTTPAQPIGSGIVSVAVGGGITGLTCSTQCTTFEPSGPMCSVPQEEVIRHSRPPRGTASAFKGFVYALDDVSGFSSLIYAFGVGATGGLTQIPGFPLPSGGTGAGNTVSERIAYDAVNGRLYAINDGSDTLSAFSVNRATGALTPLPFSPIALTSEIGIPWLSIPAARQFWWKFRRIIRRQRCQLRRHADDSDSCGGQPVHSSERERSAILGSI